MGEFNLPAAGEDTPRHKLVDFMERVQAENNFETPERSLAFLQGINYDEFENLLTRVNGICREIPAGARRLDGRGTIAESHDFSGKTTHKYSPPAPEDRLLLMQEAFKTAQNLDSPEQAGVLLGLAINSVHPFNDGNGRTSRLVYSLLVNGYDSSPETQEYYNKLLAKTAGREVVDLDFDRFLLPYQFNMTQRRDVAHRFSYKGPIPTHTTGGYSSRNQEFYDQDEESILATKNTSPAERQTLHRVIKDDEFGTTVLLDFLLESRRELSQYIEVSSDRKSCFINLDRLVPELDEEDILHLADKQDELKEKYVMYVINIFSDPKLQDLAQAVAIFYRPQSVRSKI